MGGALELATPTIKFFWLFFRRQREIVIPALFDAAVSGTSDLLFRLLDNGDDVNPVVRFFL